MGESQMFQLRKKTPEKKKGGKVLVSLKATKPLLRAKKGIRRRWRVQVSGGIRPSGRSKLWQRGGKKKTELERVGISQAKPAAF